MKLIDQLRKKYIPTDKQLDVLKMIRDDEINMSEKELGGSLSMLMDAFEYGIMIGKQQERAKKKALN